MLAFITRVSSTGYTWYLMILRNIHVINYVIQSIYLLKLIYFSCIFPILRLQVKICNVNVQVLQRSDKQNGKQKHETFRIPVHLAMLDVMSLAQIQLTIAITKSALLALEFILFLHAQRHVCTHA